MGVLQASYGPSFAGFQARFGVSELVVPRIYTATFIAMFLSTLASGPLLRRVSLRRCFVIAVSLLTAGQLLMALAPGWPTLLGGAFVAGLGYGLLAVTGNLILARIGARAAMNLVNALFGLGSILAPLLVAALAGRGVTLLYGLLALGTLAVLAGSRAFPRTLDGGAEPQAGGRGPLPTLLLFNALFFLYVAMEVSAGGWMARHLRGTFWAEGGPERAAALVSLFWVAYTVGRAASAPLAQRVPPARLTLACLVLCVLCALATALPALRLPAYALLGLCMSPIYMALISWLVGRVPERFSTLGMLGSGFGAAFGPPLVGLLLARQGVGALPLALAAFPLVGVLLSLGVWRLGRGSAARRPAA